MSDVSPAEAGVRNLPLLLSCGIGSLAAGLLISRFKHFIPLMVWASGGGCIGTGLIYTLDVNSPFSHWIGYQVLAGLAFGTGLPLAIIAGQAEDLPEDLASTTAVLLCKSITPVLSQVEAELTIFSHFQCRNFSRSGGRPISTRQPAFG